MLCLGPGPGAVWGAVWVAVARVMALSLESVWAVQIRIMQNRQIVYNETISREKAGFAGFLRSGAHVAAVDRDGLAGDEIAVGAAEKDQRAQEVLGLLVAPQRAGLHGAI